MTKDEANAWLSEIDLANYQEILADIVNRLVDANPGVVHNADTVVGALSRYCTNKIMDVGSAAWVGPHELTTIYRALSVKLIGCLP